jgi:hypothetical protein
METQKIDAPAFAHEIDSNITAYGPKFAAAAKVGDAAR